MRHVFVKPGYISEMHGWIILIEFITIRNYLVVIRAFILLKLENSLRAGDGLNIRVDSYTVWNVVGTSDICCIYE